VVMLLMLGCVFTLAANALEFSYVCCMVCVAHLYLCTDNEYGVQWNSRQRGEE
jgi:hypothetical protein